MLDQFNVWGRSSNPENTYRTQTRGNLRGEEHCHYVSNPGSGSWSIVNDAFSYHPFTFLTGTYSVYTPSVARRQFAGYDRGTDGEIDTSRIFGRFPYKRKCPDGSMAFDIRNSSWSPFEANSSISGLLDRQYDDNRNMSQNTMSLQQFSRSNHPVTLNESGRNVRLRSVTTHDHHANTSAAWNYSFESSHGPWRTSVSETNCVSTDANQFLTERQGGEADQYNHGAIAGRNAMPSLQYLEACRNRIPSLTLPTRHLGVEYEATSLAYLLQHPTESYSSSFTGRWHTNHQNDRARGAIERYTSHATIDRNDGAPLNGYHAGHGYEATSSDYCLQFPTEAYSSRYSRSSAGTGHTSYHGHRRTPVLGINSVNSDTNQFLTERHGVEAGQYSNDAIAGRWHTNYQNDRARGAVERYRSHAIMDRNDGALLNGFHAGYGYQANSSDYCLQFPTEAYSSRYSRSSTGTGHTSYHGPRRTPVSETNRVSSDANQFLTERHGGEAGRWNAHYQHSRARGAIERYTSHATMDTNVGAPLNGFHAGYGYEANSSDYTNEHFPSLAAAMNRSDSMEPQHRAFIDDIISYSPPGPRNTDADDQYEAMRLDIDNMSYEDLLVLGEHIGNVKTGLSEDKVLNCLVESLDCASEQNKEEKLCPICLDELSNMDKAMKLRRCGHEYHVHCITKWLDTKTVCPICKISVASDS